MKSVAEQRMRSEADGVNTPSTRSQWAATESPTAATCRFLCRRTRNRDVGPPGNFRAVRLVRRSSALGAGQHEVGAFLAGHAGDCVSQRAFGQHARDNDVLAVEEPQQCT